MALGQTVVALSGPVGWVAGGLTVFGVSKLYGRHNNIKKTESANQERHEVEQTTQKLVSVCVQIEADTEDITKRNNAVIQGLKHLEAVASKDYSEFSKDQDKLLAAIIRNLGILAELIVKKIE